MKRVAIAMSMASVIVLGAAGCGASSGKANNSSKQGNTSSSKQASVSLTFIQDKPEAVKVYNKLISQFEKKNPNIKITQVNPPKTDTALQTDMAKNQIPDVFAIQPNITMQQMAKQGVFVNLKGTSIIKQIVPAYVKEVETETGFKVPYIAPYAMSDIPVFYNIALFKKYHLTIPTTWNQFMKEAQQIKNAGGTPFYNGFKDSWTVDVPWNALGANEAGPNIEQKLKSGKTTIPKTFSKAAKRLQQLASFGQSNQYGIGYNDANAGFANGKSVFYVQGSWALPEILQDNPKIKVGMFAFPATNNASSNVIVADIDSGLAIHENPNKAKQAAATKFVKFLVQKQSNQQYVNDQTLIPAVQGVKQPGTGPSNMQQYFNKGKIVAFPSWYPTGMAANYPNVLQEFLVKKQSPQQLLKNLQNEFNQSIQHG